MAARRAIQLCVAAALAMTAASCGFAIEHRPAPALPTGMKTATLAELEKDFNQLCLSIKTLNIKANMKTTKGGPHAGKVDEPPDVDAYLIIEGPDKLRLSAQKTPFGTVVDLASDGPTYQLSVQVGKDEGDFFIGPTNGTPRQTAGGWEKVQPKAVLDAMLIHPITSDEDVAPFNDRVESNPNPEYGIQVFAHRPSLPECPLRRIMISRYNLLPSRQIIYDAGCNGIPVTTVAYSQFQESQGIETPRHIVVNRPVEEFSMTLEISKVTVNTPIEDPNMFHLSQPTGSKVIDLTQPAEGEGRHGTH